MLDDSYLYSKRESTRANRLLRLTIAIALAVPSLVAAQSSDAGDAGAGDAAAGDAAPPTPTYFEDETDYNFPTPPCANPDDPDAEGCYTNFLVLSDLESDGDMDIVFANGGGYYRPGDAEPSAVYLNDGTGAFRDATQSIFQGATSRLRQVAIGDVDGDGDRDIYQPGGYGLDLDKLWIQTSKGKFQDKATALLPAEMLLLDGGVGTSMPDGGADGGVLAPGLRSKAASAHLGDLDGDGDLDLAIGDWGDISGSPKTVTTVRLYSNDGKGVFTALPLSATPPPLPGPKPAVDPDAGTLADGGVMSLPLYGSGPLDLDMHDVDGDFDLDLLVIGRNGQSRIFFNEGNFKFSDGTAGYPVKKGPYQYNQELCDIDGDGDLDLLVDNSGGTIARGKYVTQVNLNDGKGVFTDVTKTAVTAEPGGDDNAVKCMDVNADGHFDLVTASLSHSSEKLLLNSGTGTFTYIENAFPMIDDPSLGIDAADLNGDGILDIVTGQGEGEPRIDRVYFGYGMSKKDVTPPKFRAIERPVGVKDNPIIVRLAISDATTSETGEHVKDVGIEYTVDGGALKVAPGVFIGGDLFRVEVPAQPEGSTLRLTATATDRAGLTAKSESFQITIGMPVPDAGMAIEPPGMMDMDSGVLAPGMDVDAGVPAPGIDAGVVPMDLDPNTAEPMMDDEPRGKDDDDGCSVSSSPAGFGGSGLLFLVGLSLLPLGRKRLSSGLSAARGKDRNV